MENKYKYKVMETMKKKGKTQADIRKENIIGQSQLTRIRNNKPINIDTLNKLAIWLDCNVRDLID